MSSSEKKTNLRIVQLIHGEREVESETFLTTDDIAGSYVCIKGEKVWVAS